MQKIVLDSITYDIPIEDFETDMNTDSPKDKKERILDLFRNHNELKLEEEYKDIKSQLHYACKEGDLELIKILLSETIEDDSRNFLLKIDKTNKTASFYGSNQKLYDLIIPRTDKHKKNDYLVTSICGLHSSIYSEPLNIKFDEESAVCTIYGYSFEYSNIKEISIPNSVTKICERAFYYCRNLRKVEFSKNSNLQTIEKYAFSNSKIKKISIPYSMTKISRCAFSNCSNLRKIEIPTNSNLQIIEEYAFSRSNIEEIYFPKSLIELKDGWCSDTRQLTRIIISPFNDQFIFKEDKYLIGKSNQNNAEFDKLLFVPRDIKEISIPLNIKIIGSYSFDYSKIEEISIPHNVTKISGCAFYNYNNLRKVKIPTNSNLQTIEKYAFSYSKIKEFSIPHSVTKICENAFSSCYKLQIIEISEESQLQSISISYFEECPKY